MLFWIFVVIAAVAAVWVFWVNLVDGIGISTVFTVFAELFVLCLFGLALLVGNSVFGWTAELKGTQTDSLKAIGTRTGLEGHSYFLGGGYVKDKRVLNYITQDSGRAIHVQQADASSSDIYEDAAGAPTVITKHWDCGNGWLTPWPLGSSDTYEFHIPAGSVLENYTIDNSK